MVSLLALTAEASIPALLLFVPGAHALLQIVVISGRGEIALTLVERKVAYPLTNGANDSTSCALARLAAQVGVIAQCMSLV